MRPVHAYGPVVLLVATALAACGSSTELTDRPDAAGDVAAETIDLGTDTEIDASPDAPPLDTPADVPDDVSKDVAPLDVPADDPADAPPLDAPIDVPAVDMPAVDMAPVDVSTCTSPSVMCGTVCVDLNADRANCGACGRACTAMQFCISGRCICECPTGLVCCGTPLACVDSSTSPAHCGACGQSCDALPGVRAGATRCVMGRCDATGACVSGRAACGAPSAGCTTDITTPSNCGACGRVCPTSTPLCAMTGSGTWACTSGCGAAAPTRCGMSCVDTVTDPRNCGACGTVCAAPANGAPVCAASRCDFTCTAGFHRCGASCAANASAASCGTSCTPCPAPANATATCTAGACGITCTTGFHLCGGACVANTAVATCGTSCTACPTVANGTATCSGTACGVACNAGFHLCGGACVANTAVATCGASCTTCPAPANGTATCDGTACGATCNAGFHRCGADCVSNTAPTSCGVLCVPCGAPANATAVCTSGVCDFTCNAGYTRSGGSCVAVGSLTPPRLLWPPSTARLTARRLGLYWSLAAGTDGARVEVCRDRACATTVSTFDATGSFGVTPVDLPPGTLFWRLRGRLGAAVGTTASAPWEFTVPVRTTGVGTAWGSVFDANGDGVSDLLAGAPGTGGGTGRSYIYPGRASAGLSTTYLTRLTGLAGANAYYGNSVASAGDVNGDGYGDALIGSYLANVSNGRVDLYAGSAAGPALVPSNTVLSPDTGAYFGYSVTGAGDLNRDGYADIAVGGYLANGGRGRVYIFYGQAGGITARPNVTLESPATGSASFGISVAGVGDVNGDVYSDLIVGANGVNTNVGAAYLYLGSASGIATTPAVTFNGTDARGSFGYSVGGVGDLNGDGFPDLGVGAYNALTNTGRAFVYLGRAGAPAATASFALTGPDASGYFGYPITTAGDVNGDGFNDLLVGAQNAAGTVGRAHVFFGAAAGIPATPSVTLTGPDGVGGAFGYGAASVGDVNADGYGDIAIGAYTATGSAGRVHVYLGRATGLATTPATSITGPDGAGSQFGTSID